MDMDAYIRQLREGKNGEALQRLAESDVGAALTERFGGSELEAAIRRGDTQMMMDQLQSLLSTPEGRSFARQVKKAVDGRGG